MTPKELNEAVAYNTSELKAGNITAIHLAQLVEHWQQSHGLEEDGKCGAKTRATLDAAVPRISTKPRSLSTWNGPMEIQPTNRREVYKIFGNPGAGELDKDWFRKNIVECHGKTRLPGVPGKWYVQIHRLVEPYLREALRRAQLVAPEYKIERCGSFNFRHSRHDPSKPLSMHSFGIAVDINPRDNYSRTFPKGKAPPAWSSEYNDIWPRGVPKAFVEAFSSCGFAWGNDWDEDGFSVDHTYYDPMHFEWVARDGKANLV